MAANGNNGRGPAPFVPLVPVAVPTGRLHYTHEFETVQDRQINRNLPPGGGRARSYSFGIYDPSTNVRTDRVHQHVAPDNTITASHARPDEYHPTEFVNRGTSVSYTPETRTMLVPFVHPYF